LETISLPDKITQISGWTFNGCTSLTSIKLPSNLTTIGARAFHWCTNLAEIEIPNSVILIDENAFDNCTKLETISFIPGMTPLTIASRAFNQCLALHNLVLPSRTTTIEDEAFFNAGIHELTIGNGHEPLTIGARAFSGNTLVIDGVLVGTNSISTISIGNNLVSVGEEILQPEGNY
jgi:hypothetical protein